MTFNIIVEDEAKQDLLNIYKYICKNDSQPKAKNFILELQKKIQSLDSVPYRCRNSYYTDNQNTKDLIHKKYTIVFKVINNNIHVLTVFRQKSY